ncbi:hypothetical protein [Novosphingobium pokkalii]|uniref:Helix-turn-helix domain-containing protein n=1 Tax=Novosphingobium pokkalii TaxID=1770194 RepID=A0ABV7V6D8_9SPHN|nr:hypothetical protein [Novosphingobium pokkalii]GHC97596.1 hypothetical protein GCM10019060_28520 [Novosphingobium pokkalii]
MTEPAVPADTASAKVSLAGLTWTERTTYRALAEAAEAGLPCPSNIDIEMLCGYNSCSMGPVMVKRLERKGFIRVERYQRFRIVEIVATGARTARAANMRADTPHIPKGTHTPTRNLPTSATPRPSDRKPYKAGKGLA